MNMIRSALIFFFGVFFLFSSSADSAWAEGKVYLDITASGTRKINMAVPPFSGSGQSGGSASLGQELSSILEKALEFHGIISIKIGRAHV